jgi:hypothetical protein
MKTSRIPNPTTQSVVMKIGKNSKRPIKFLKLRETRQHVHELNSLKFEKSFFVMTRFLQKGVSNYIWIITCHYYFRDDKSRSGKRRIYIFFFKYQGQFSYNTFIALTKIHLEMHYKSFNVLYTNYNEIRVTNDTKAYMETY